MGRTSFEKSLKTVIAAVILFSLFLSMAYPGLKPAPRATAAIVEKWERQTSGTTRNLSRVYFADSKNGWAAGDGGTVLRTANGGATWTILPTSLGVNLKGIFFVSSEDGWVVGDNGFAARTRDGGQTWSRLETSTPSVLRDIEFRDINTGWAVGNDGVMLRTTDGGGTWIRQVLGTNRHLHNLVIVDVNNLWITGDGGQFARSTDGGMTWMIQPAVAVSSTLYGISFSSQSRGWAVGEIGNAIETTDGGASWTRVNLPSPRTLRDVRFVDGSTGWIIGDGGTILNTRNGGQTWQVNDAIIPNNLNSLSFPDKENGWAVGDGGVILKYTLTEVFGPTQTAIHQDINESGFVVASLDIEKITDPATGQSRPAAKGIMNVSADLTYDPGISILNFGGVPPFEKADIRVNVAARTVSFAAVQTGAEPQPPLSLARFSVKLDAPATQQVKVNVNFERIIEGSGRDIPQFDPFSVTFQRGDADGNGRVDDRDASRIADFLAGKAKKSDLNLVNAAGIHVDSPEGNKVTVKDAMFLLQRSAGIRDDGFRPATTFWADMLTS